jgi:hypothetical protein
MFAVYVDDPNKKALVHSQQCGHFANRKCDSTGNGYWKTGFASRDAAFAFAKTTGKARAESAKGCCDKF